MKKVGEIFKHINEVKDSLEFLPTGLNSVDEGLDGGFLRQELVVIGGFTGLGKSYLAGQIMFNIATKGFNTAYFSLEISSNMVVSRLLGQEADIKSIKIVSGNLTTQEEKRKQQAQGKLYAYEDYMSFYDQMYDFEQIAGEIRKHNYDFIVIDFIQNVILTKKDEYERLSYVALQLQKIAKEKNCCILILSQLSNSIARNVENSNLEYKGSGSIATVCDLGFLLMRDFEIGMLELILRKNRRGSSGTKWQFTFKGEGGKII